MSFPRYPEYKDSGVEWLGAVPTHWQAMSLRRIVKGVQTGSTPSTEPPSSDLDSGLVWYTPGDFRESLYLAESERKISFEVVEAGEVKQFPSGSVLVVSIGATLGKVGYIRQTSSANQQINAIIPNALIDGYFLAYSLSVKSEAMRFLSNASTIGIMNQERTKDIWLSVPPRVEQSAITLFLDRETAKLDDLMAEQEKLITLLKEKRQAVIAHAVTKGLDPTVPMKESGIEWLGTVPESWDVKRLSSISTKITNGYVGPTRDILLDEGVRYLQSLHIKKNEIRFNEPYFVSLQWSLDHQKSILQTGDVLIVQTGDIGQVAVVTEEFEGCNCHALIIVSPLRTVILGEWLSWVLNSEYGFHSLLSIQTGALHPHLNCGNVKELFIPVPPLETQAEVVKYLATETSKFDELISTAQSAIDLLKERRTALISAAVSGQIDVRGLIKDEQEQAA